jgi:hypothetical protein
MAPQAESEEVTRVEVRPGLIMVKRRTIKEDGRYLYYYDFERRAAASPVAAQENA